MNASLAFWCSTYTGSTNSFARIPELMASDCAVTALTGSEEADLRRRAISSGGQ